MPEVLMTPFGRQRVLQMRSRYLEDAGEHVFGERVLEAALSGARDCRSQCRHDDNLPCTVSSGQREGGPGEYIVRALVEEAWLRASEGRGDLVLELIQSFCHVERIKMRFDPLFLLSKAVK